MDDRSEGNGGEGRRQENRREEDTVWISLKKNTCLALCWRATREEILHVDLIVEMRERRKLEASFRAKS